MLTSTISGSRCRVSYWRIGSKDEFRCDSNSVIFWVRSDHRLDTPFVANMVAEILESSKIKQWRWIPGKENPVYETGKVVCKIQPG